MTITPELIVSFATLVTALTALVRVLLTHQTIQHTAADVKTIQQQTNGALQKLQAQNEALQTRLTASGEGSPIPLPPVNQ